MNAKSNRSGDARLASIRIGSTVVHTCNASSVLRRISTATDPVNVFLKVLGSRDTMETPDGES